jgi:REP element-mobilizing transposase RayT
MTDMPKRARQLGLDLRPPIRWGGRRAGAGRKPGPIPRAPHRRRPGLATRFPCHVTLKLRRGLPSLRAARFVRELERSWRQACERGRFRVAHYSIQGDHVHAIVEAASSADLASGMKSIAARLARAANSVFARRGPVLADRYHLHVLRTPREVRHALAYVLLNSRRHAAKLGRSLRSPAQIDPASSGRWFDGWGAPAPAPSPGPPAVAPPRSWLLRMGWRRHGLVRPDEVPGPWDRISKKRCMSNDVATAEIRRREDPVEGLSSCQAAEERGDAKGACRRGVQILANTAVDTHGSDLVWWGPFAWILWMVRQRGARFASASRRDPAPTLDRRVLGPHFDELAPRIGGFHGATEPVEVRGVFSSTGARAGSETGQPIVPASLSLTLH